VLFSMRKMDTFIGGEGLEQIDHAQRLSLVAWLSGWVAAVLIGFLNPYGIVIVLISSVASSMGGTSGLAWMMQMLNCNKPTGKRRSFSNTVGPARARFFSSRMRPSSGRPSSCNATDVCNRGKCDS